VCTIDQNSAVFTGIGTCTIRASQAGNSNYTAATSVDKSFTITKGYAYIEVADYIDGVPDGNWATFNVGDDPYTAFAFSSSGATVSFLSTTTGVCTTTGLNGTVVTILAAGSCKITVSAPATTNYNAPTNVELDFTVAKGIQTTLVAVATANHIAITPTVTVDFNTGSGTTTLSSTGGTGSGGVTYATSSTGCSITTTTLTATQAAVTAGCVVTATKTFDSNYESTTSASITVPVGLLPVAKGSAAAPTGGTKAAAQIWTGQSVVWNTAATITYQWYICTAVAAAPLTTFLRTEAGPGAVCVAASGTSTNINYSLPTLVSPATYTNRWWRLRVRAAVTLGGTTYYGYAWTQTR